MRIAVHLPAGHPTLGINPEGHPQAGEPAEPRPFAYRLGRIEDGVHNHVLHTGETIPIDEFLDGLLEQARAEYPDAKIVVERLVDNGDNTSRWVPADEYDPEQHTAQAPGGTKETEVSVQTGQAAG